MVAVALAQGKSATVSARAELAAAPARRFGIVRLGQPAAITLAVLIICAVMALISEPFRSYDNLYNDSRNFGFVAIMGMGQMLVIITGGACRHSPKAMNQAARAKARSSAGVGRRADNGTLSPATG